jgi:hypothetical protein
MHNRWKATALALGLVMAGAYSQANAFVLHIQSPDFITTRIFSTVTTFAFTIFVDEPLAAGTTYSDPSIQGVDYTVTGALSSAATSGIVGGFLLQRPSHPPVGGTFSGSEFYGQGSSLQFATLPSANLIDGLQVNELADLGGGLVFELDAREVGTGRYHPPILQLFNDGTGLFRNSNNSGGTNPVTGQVVDVDYGDEYITELAFDPQALTLVQGISAPAGLLLLAPLAAGAALIRRRALNPI